MTILKETKPGLTGLLAALTLLVTAIAAIAVPAESVDSADPARLQTLVNQAVEKTLADFATHKLATNQFAMTAIDLRDPIHPIQAAYRGEEQIYPASVVKLFYLVDAHRQMEDGQLHDTPELRRAMHDMIVYSYNDATSYVLDSLTGTTSGPELPPTELAQWQDKRNTVNRYFASLGYTNINVNKKPWGEGPYGREVQASQTFKPNRNLLTTDATARLMAEIATGRAVSPDRCEQMKVLLRRDFSTPGDPDTQAHDFIARALPAGARLWSKAGYTSTARHDAAYIELPNGARLVLVIFTTGQADEQGILPSLARVVIDGMSAAP
jgi:Beta-lactamase enzyme family